MANDKKTIGLTPNTRQIMDKIMESSIFKDQIDVAKFAMSLAIRANVEPNHLEGTITSWNVGSFDPDGELRDLITILFPDVDTPYRHLEELINAGLEIIEQHLAENKDFDIVSLLEVKNV